MLWIWRHEGTPAERARGIAVGVFSGCFPFFGLQSLMGICLASLFRGNHLLAVTATWISNPFTYIPLYWFNYKIGAFFLGGASSFNDLHKLTKRQIWDQGWIVSSKILLGSLILGLALGLLLGLASYIGFKSSSNKNTLM
ncbi:hypothetical protein EV07_0196 [Prochlorococcus sp. MIT 0603]|nr:hypothetical protein EV07_0196 [Prochlorococcus sp. MIT 0603]